MAQLAGCNGSLIFSEGRRAEALRRLHGGQEGDRHGGD